MSFDCNKHLLSGSAGGSPLLHSYDGTFSGEFA